MNEVSPHEGRPYRSHAHPACLPCKKRKTRCKTTDSSERCVMCQLHGTVCLFPYINSRPTPGPGPARSYSPRGQLAVGRRLKPPVVDPMRSAARGCPKSSRRQPGTGDSVRSQYLCVAGQQDYLQPAAYRIHDEGRIPVITGIVADTGESSSHVVSPVVVDDNNVLEKYLSAAPEMRYRCSSRTNLNPGRLARQVLFDTIPRRPLGVSANQSLAAMKCDVIEKYMEPDLRTLLDAFFIHANPCFPVFDKTSFEAVVSAQREKTSPALLCNLYANALIYYHNIPNAQSRRSLDNRYIWNQANEALHSELFLSPGISTVVSIILNIGGRPSTAIFGNGGMIGAAVALSNALGLNRDPLGWNIPALEKKFRIRIWWLILIHDRWCSLAYGTPLLVHRAQYDVRRLKQSDLCETGASVAESTAASIFIALTTLTEVLGCYLEQIYAVSETLYQSRMPGADLERMLSEWEDSLTDDIRRSILRGNNLDAPGAANLRLGYLTVKLLLKRIQLDLEKDVMRTEDDAVAPSLIHAQRAAEEIVHLVQELNESHLRGFWMPMHAFSLTSATTLLLRIGVRIKNTSRNIPFGAARSMIKALKSHREHYGWDLADHCLSNCTDLVAKIGSLEPETGFPAQVSPELQESLDIDPSILEELFTGIPGLLEDNEVR